MYSAMILMLQHAVMDQFNQRLQYAFFHMRPEDSCTGAFCLRSQVFTEFGVLSDSLSQAGHYVSRTRVRLRAGAEITPFRRLDRLKIRIPQVRIMCEIDTRAAVIGSVYEPYHQVTCYFRGGVSGSALMQYFKQKFESIILREYEAVLMETWAELVNTNS